MTSLESALGTIATELSRLNADFALVGGLAVSVRTEPRFTRDADLAVAVQGDAEAERLIHSLRSSGFLVRTVVEQESVGRLATVRLAFSPQGQTPVVDLLFASSGIETEIVAAADTLELLPSLRMRVAAVGHLIALKVLSRDDVHRPQDLVDLRALLRVASTAEVLRAREALALITARRFNRGRALQEELARLGEPSTPS